MAAYEQLLAQVTAAVEPADVLEEIWVRDVVDLTWEALRYRRDHLLAACVDLPLALARLSRLSAGRTCAPSSIAGPNGAAIAQPP